MKSKRLPLTFTRFILIAAFLCFGLSSSVHAQYQTANSGVGTNFFSNGIYSSLSNNVTARLNARLNPNGQIEIGGCIASPITGIPNATYNLTLSVRDGSTGSTLFSTTTGTQPLPGSTQNFAFSQTIFTPSSPVSAGAQLDLVYNLTLNDGNSFNISTQGQADGQVFSSPNPKAPGSYNVTTRRYGPNSFQFTCGAFSSLPACPTVAGSSFSASPASINTGQSSTLTWNVPNATSVSISGVGGGLPASGSVIVSPATTTTYTLTSSGGTDCAPIQLQATVNVTACQAISSYSASATTINAGASTILSYSLSGASSATITDLSTGAVTSVPVQSGSLTVTPATTRTYRLSAAGSCATVTQDITITVNQPPSIASLTASPSSICAGANSTLSWTSSGGTSATITDLSTGAVTTVPVSGSLVVTPASTRTYRLTVSNGAGSVTSDVVVSVTPLAAINNFSATPSSINAGGSTTLSFNVSNTTARTITDLSTGAVTTLATESGTQVVSPATSRSYRLTASNGCNTVTLDVAITVTQSPVISTFAASSSPVCSGGASTLSWTATGGTTATISAPGLPGSPVSVNPNGGNLIVNPASTTTYTLTVTNGAGSDTRTVTVTVTPAPTIATFTATPSAINAGQNSTLAWTSSNGTSATITDLTSGAITNVPVNGSLVVTPASTRNYRLTVNGACGTVTQTLTVTVTPCQTIVSLNASATTITTGQSATLLYNLTGATSATITDLTSGTVTNVPVQSGSLVVTPASTRTYRLSAIGACATVTQDITITVNQPCQTIDSFTVNGSASNTTAVQGSTVTVSYSISNFTSASLLVFQNSTPVQTIPLTAASGSLTFTQPSDSSAYRLTVNGACATVTRDLIVTSTCATAVVNSYTATPSTIAPGGSATLSYSVSNAYYVTIRRLSDNVDIYNSAAQTGSIVVTPPATTTYRILTGTTAGCPFAIQDLTVTVNQLPVANSFTASPSAICPGASSNLSWTATNGVSATISAPGLPGSPVSVNASSGSLSVSPADTTTYTFTVTGAGGQTDSKQATVTVNPNASISSYAATATTITAGQSTTFNFTTANATTATITDLSTGTATPVSVPSGSLSVSPASTRTYRLSATNSCGTATQDILITVNPLVCQTIDSFTVNGFSTSPTTAVQGSTVTVAYSISNFTSATLLVSQNFTPVQNIQLTAASGTFTFTQASASTSYRLTINGACESFTQELVVYSTCATISINSFAAAPPVISPGDSTTLSYSVTSPAYYVIIRRLSDNVDIYGSDALTGSLVVTPAVTTTYRILTGTTTSCPVVQQDVTVTVNQPPGASSFTATPAAICAGASSNLSWSGTNGVSATISAPGLAGSPISVDPNSGTLSVSPADTTTYTFTVTGAGGQTSSLQTTVTVTPLAAINSFTATPQSITSGQSTTLNYSTANASSATITDLSTGEITNVTVPSGSLSVSPATSRNYRLSVTSSCGTVTQDVSVTVNAVVCQSIDSFTVNGFSTLYSTAEIGSTVTVSYSISNFTSAFLNASQNFTPTQYIQLTAPSGTLTFTQASHSTAYRLTVNGACGSYMADLVVYSTCPTVTVNSWTATPPAIASGQPSTLAWDVTNAYYVYVRRLSDNVDIYGVNGGAPATGSIVVNPTETTTYRIIAGTSNNGCPFAQQDVTVTVDTPSVLIGPQGQPDAIGPNDNNDDYTNMTLTAGVAAPMGGTTTAGGVITFTNTIRNVSALSQQLTLQATSIPQGFIVEASLNGGATWINLSGAGATGTLTANQQINLPIRVTAPSGLSVLTAHPVVLRVSHTNTPSIFNETIDRLYSGFIRADKSVTVTNSTGAGGATDAVPGAVIEYTLNYSNITTASGTGNINLTATNVVLTEDGNAAPNNWASTTNHVAGSATDSRGGTITGDVAGSSLLRDIVPSLAPAQSGIFKFRRVIK